MYKEKLLKSESRRTWATINPCDETNDKYSCNSCCRPGCRIFHQKHDWVRSISKDLIEKFNDIRNIWKNKCTLCDQSFGNISEVEEHIRYDHIDEKCENFFERGSEHLNKSHTFQILGILSWQASVQIIQIMVRNSLASYQVKMNTS